MLGKERYTQLYYSLSEQDLLQPVANTNTNLGWEKENKQNPFLKENATN